MKCRFETVGRNKFFSQTGQFGQNYGVSGGKEGVVGFFSSLRPVTGWKDAGALLLNVDSECIYIAPSLMVIMSFKYL